MWSKTKEKILFTHKIHPLEHFGALQLFPNETIRIVQRQHWVVLIVPFLVLVLILASVSFLISLVLQNAHILPLSQLHEMSTYTIVTLLCIVLVAGVFIFMRWYFQFYIITNKRLLHIHFFRIGGYYMEEVFLEKLLECEVDSKASNFIYDLLGIEDVYIHFGNIEHNEPFVFEAPSNAQKIEYIVNEHSIKQHKRTDLEPV
ncbi:MAG TPA: hypothetical protein VLF68_02940 [Candidatus Saccharimonadales bacterium]|nr:hypothetical protein [Candidatus Saccharimonadales bacterium]